MVFINKLKQIENIISKNANRLSFQSSNLLNEYSLSSSDKLENDIKEISARERLLRIGIVGRVKAGKSSLINAIIFGGKNVLPKAATPMTAALTELSYGDSYRAEVEFFTKADIDNIASEAKEYTEKLESEIKLKVEELKTRSKNKDTNISELEEKAKKRVERELASTNLAASYDQYSRIISSNIKIDTLENKVVSFNSIEELEDRLIDYVGANGPYMPFTKSVKIQLPIDTLEDISIVDTPGINDPVVSREQRTKDELAKCDVIFIVSPAGQFMSSEDIDLMDRITKKNGIRELFVIASKCDTQLQGSIQEESNGVLHKAFEKLVDDLSTHLHDTLLNLKNEYQEVGDTFDSLIENSKNSIIHSSGQAFTIKENLRDLSKLDEGEAHTWQLLKSSYPNNFSDTNFDVSLASLEYLSNIDTIKKILDSTAARKEKIMNEKVEEFITQKSSIVDKYLSSLIDYISQRENEIKNSNIEELEKTQKALQKKKDEGTLLLNTTFRDIVSTFSAELQINLNTKLNELFSLLESDIRSSETTVTETYTNTIDVGAGFLWIREILGTRYQTKIKTREVFAVRTGFITSSLNILIADIENAISFKAQERVLSFKKDTPRRLLSELRSSIDDELISDIKFRALISSIINKIELPDISYNHISLHGGNGIKKGKDARRFLDYVRNSVYNLKNDVKMDIKNYLTTLEDKLLSINLGDDLFSELDNDIERLKKDIQNKNLSLEELSSVKKELINIK